MPVSIMLDAGHGGRDPGAVYNGRQEKDDVLKLVLAIGEILQNSGIDVEYTRTTDIYETPFQKATEANEAGVDFFISIRYTQEEQNYLNLYEQDLKGLRDGDPLKELLPAILTMAKEMHRADIYIGDLVQEGNMGLMLAMEDHADDTEALLSMAKESMQALLESQEETKKQDNRMVEKVNDLDEQIKKLSDELGRKVSVDELEEFAGITEDEISNILKLAGEELPPEEK